MSNAFQRLLAGLDDVGWAGLSHAYGSAEDARWGLTIDTSEEAPGSPPSW
ncbi:hypothetical protein [Streptomyces eurythermus]